MFLPPLAQYNLVQQDSVQFVPYYYYYPVPDTTSPLPPVFNTQAEISQPVSAHPKFTSSSSCDSSIESKVRKYKVRAVTSPALCKLQVVRRRRKKKRSQEKDETDDSGYFNGPDSSAETSSDEDRGQAGELGITLKLGDKREEYGDDHVDEAELGVVNIEFGDVQEILDELSRETNQSETEEKTDSELSEEREERREVTELKHNQEENRDKQERSSMNTEEPETKPKKRSTNKRTKITSSHNNESKDASLSLGFFI